MMSLCLTFVVNKYEYKIIILAEDELLDWNKKNFNISCALLELYFLNKI